MSSLAMACRVCRGNVGLKSIINSGLQETYRRITRSELYSAVNHRITMCRTCVSQLQRFRRVSDAAHRGKGIREELSKIGIEITGRNISMLNLESTPLLSVCVVGHVTLNNNSVYSLKEEAADEDDDLTNIDRSMDDITQGDSLINEGQHFPKETNLKNYIHMKIHTGVKHACKRCKKTFSYSCNLKRHMRIHTGEKPFACKRCEKTFVTSTCLITHMRIHTGEQPYVCQWCKKCFVRSSNLKRHMKIHRGEKLYVCKGCDKTFKNASNLTEHMRTHIKPCACKRCEK